MSSDMGEAREFANVIRFSGDSLRSRGQTCSSQSNALKDLFYCNELCISRDVTPDLYKSLETVMNKLSISIGAVEAFVYASPDINAQCYSSDEYDCIIRVSSALIDILSKEEFEFVIGHELGHFLLSHSIAREENYNESVEFYMQQRAQEISADRLGLIACDSLDIAVKALLKTVSGLNDQHLRFDVGSFLSQLRKTSDVSRQHNASTHPSILVRCRALLWFSLNDAYMNNSRSYTETDLRRLDKKIQSDLDKYVDRSVKRRIDEAKENLSMWIAVREIVEDKKFTKDEQIKFADSFGQETLDKLIGFLGSVSSSEIKSAVSEKVEIAKNELESLIPSKFEDEIKSLVK